LDDLRAARGLLRQLPMRKAPRNFTLTPKMVGKKSPLPRSYPAFRFVTALASLMLFFTLGLNFVVPQMASQSPEFGYGGGGAPDLYPAQEAPAAESAPATEAPAAEAAAEEPSILMAPAPTQTISPAADSTARELDTPDEKQGVTNETDAMEQPPAPSPVQPPVPQSWLIALAGITLLGALIMLVMRQAAASRWRK
jgi:hypothetical protein